VENVEFKMFETVLVGNDVRFKVDAYFPDTKETKSLLIGDNSLQNIIIYGIDHLAQSNLNPFAIKMLESMIKFAEPGLEELENGSES
jgi:hypothetical protein